MTRKLRHPRFLGTWFVAGCLHGKHDGWGAFGTPTGADVFILGACHAEFGPWGLRREWMLYDETAIWKQILLGTD